MFGLFKNKKSIHEPVKLQRQEVQKAFPEAFASTILNGEDCDQITGGHGNFGSLTNPIPVNGSIGEIKYLAKLRGETGCALLFHRGGSTPSPVTDKPVDDYEVVCLDGTQWNTLYFDMYHPRRSNLAPPGYSLMPCIKKLKMDSPIGFGVNFPVKDFPFELPDALERFHGGSDAFARRAREWLAKGNFSRP